MDAAGFEMSGRYGSTVDAGANSGFVPMCAIRAELTIAGALGAKTDEVNRGLRGESFLLAYAIDLQSISEREASIHARLMYPS
jgi:hypothetical protein